MKQFEKFLKKLMEVMEKHGIPAKEIYEIIKEALES